MCEDHDEICGIPSVNERWIREFFDGISEIIRVNKIILFGSRAIEDHTAWSDYDLCVVSPDFHEMKPWERMELLLSHWHGERGLEVICYTPQEFEELDITLLREIRNKGKTLIESE